MTLSIIARCPRHGDFGIAAATAMPAVGKLLTHACAGTGAVATQALLNPYLGIDGLRYLANGMSAQQVIGELYDGDPQAERRQCAVIDRNGHTASWTGKYNKHWAGAVSGSGFSVQGNRLTGADVVEKAAKAFEDMADDYLVDRLIGALAAGIEAGGDRFGERSSTVYIVNSEEYPLWDIRVDEHDDPIGELMRLRAVFGKDVLPHITQMPTRAHPEGGPDDYDV